MIEDSYLNLMKTTHVPFSIYSVGIYGFPMDATMKTEEGVIIAPKINPYIASDWWENYEIADKLMLSLKDKIVEKTGLQPYNIHQNVVYKTSESDKNPILLSFLLDSVTYQGIMVIESKVWTVNVAAL